MERLREVPDIELEESEAEVPTGVKSVLGRIDGFALE